MNHAFRLIRKADGLYLLFPDGNQNGIAVRPVWARPLSDRGHELSFLDRGKKEIARLSDPSTLDADSRSLLDSEMAIRYLIPVITKIQAVRAHLGALYWTVETDAGPRRFAMKDPTESVVSIPGGGLILRDCTGNRYEIASLDSLDKDSRRRILLVI